MLQDMEPTELRIAAHRIRNSAMTVATIGARYGQVIDSLQFEGPAADRLRIDTTRQLHLVSRLVAVLADQQLLLLREAAVREAGGFR